MRILRAHPRSISVRVGAFKLGKYILKHDHLMGAWLYLSSSREPRLVKFLQIPLQRHVDERIPAHSRCPRFTIHHVTDIVVQLHRYRCLLAAII